MRCCQDQGNLSPREAAGEGDRQGQEGHAALQDAESTFLLNYLVARPVTCSHSEIYSWDLREMYESPLDCKEIKPVNPKGNQT